MSRKTLARNDSRTFAPNPEGKVAVIVNGRVKDGNNLHATSFHAFGADGNLYEISRKRVQSLLEADWKGRNLEGRWDDNVLFWNSIELLGYRTHRDNQAPTTYKDYQ